MFHRIFHISSSSIQQTLGWFISLKNFKVLIYLISLSIFSPIVFLNLIEDVGTTPKLTPVLTMQVKI